jgi:hypothetical protein
MADRPVAAVMDFEYRAPDQAYAKSATGLADGVATALVGTGRLKLVERRRIETVIAEAKLGLTGIIDSAKAVEVGKMVGAEYIIVGSVTNVSVRDEWRSLLLLSKTTRYVDVEAEARMFSVREGVLVAGGRAVGKAEGAEKHVLFSRVGEMPSKESLVQAALIGLGESLAHDLAVNIQGK